MRTLLRTHDFLTQSDAELTSNVKIESEKESESVMTLTSPQPPWH